MPELPDGLGLVGVGVAVAIVFWALTVAVTIGEIIFGKVGGGVSEMVSVGLAENRKRWLISQVELREIIPKIMPNSKNFQSTFAMVV